MKQIAVAVFVLCFVGLLSGAIEARQSRWLNPALTITKQWRMQESPSVLVAPFLTEQQSRIGQYHATFGNSFYFRDRRDTMGYGLYAAPYAVLGTEQVRVSTLDRAASTQPPAREMYKYNQSFRGVGMEVGVHLGVGAAVASYAVAYEQSDRQWKLDVMSIMIGYRGKRGQTIGWQLKVGIASQGATTAGIGLRCSLN